MKAFRQLCQKAEIYPFFQKKFLEEFGITITDGESKQVFCRGFFGDYTIAPVLDREQDKILKKGLPLHQANGKLNGNFTILSIWIIRKHFPTLFKINKELKDLNWLHLIPGMSEKDYKQYANNCLLLQRVESAIILKRISKDLIDKGIIFITIHDSFIFLKSNEWEVKRVIKENFKRLGMQPPKLKLNHLS